MAVSWHTVHCFGILSDQCTARQRISGRECTDFTSCRDPTPNKASGPKHRTMTHCASVLSSRATHSACWPGCKYQLVWHKAQASSVSQMPEQQVLVPDMQQAAQGLAPFKAGHIPATRQDMALVQPILLTPESKMPTKTPQEWLTLLLQGRMFPHCQSQRGPCTPAAQSCAAHHHPCSQPNTKTQE